VTGHGDRPRVGISRCLLGDEVRYDGGHKLEAVVVSELGRVVEWIAVCPEVEIGMGVPREPIQLWRMPDGDHVRLLGVRSGADWTERMRAWSMEHVRELRPMGLCGYVLKARSPSCGPRDVPIHVGGSDDRVDSGRGRFADVLVELIPGLPIEDEEQLRDAGVRERFLEHVRSYAGLRAQASGPRR
jgi:uncharacterized protein YbbK (DUF523 family)